MKVMLISGRYPPEPCGIGDYTSMLADDLIHQGHRVTVLSSLSERTIVDTRSASPHVETIRRMSGWNFRHFRHIAGVLEERAVDILHIQYQSSSFDDHPMMTLVPLIILLKFLRSKKKMRIVVTMHEFGGPTHPLVPRRAQRLWLLPLLVFSHAIIVTNDYHLSYLRKMPWLRNKVRLISSGSNIEAPEQGTVDKSILRRKLGLDEEDVLLVRFGFVDSIRFRQLDILLYALKHVCQRGHRVKMLFVGGGDSNSRVEMMSLARSIGIEDRLLWTGFCSPEEVASCLASADIGVFPFADGANERRTSLLAALAFGLPIVSTKGRHPSPFLTHGENLILVPPGEPIPLADAIEEIIHNKGFREKLSKNARLSSKQFNWEKIGHATDELYRSLIR